jgi:hypothetical protein
LFLKKNLITNLNFNQINNVGVEAFISQYGGIDGQNANLNGKFDKQIPKKNEKIFT